MAIPTGSGSEVLKRIVATDGDSETVALLTVPALHIITSISLIISNRSGTAGSFNCSISVVPSGGAFTYIMNNAGSLGPDSTFVFNDKFVLTAADVISVACNSSGFDVWWTYIDQDWS